MSVMMLAASFGHEITVSAEGEDSQEAILLLNSWLSIDLGS